VRTVSTPEPSGPSTGPTRLTRRRFLAATGVAGVGALGLAATHVPWADVFASMGDADPAAGILVVVTLYGGNDGLGTVIPASDPAYQDAPRSWPTGRGRSSTSARASGSTPRCAG